MSAALRTWNSDDYANRLKITAQAVNSRSYAKRDKDDTEMWLYRQSLASGVCLVGDTPSAK